MPDTETLNRAWNAFLLAPLPLALTVAALIGFAWLWAWLLRGHIAKGQVDALKERLEHAKDQVQTLTNDLATSKQDISRQNTVIENLRKNPSVPAAQVEVLQSANTMVANTLDRASHTAGTLLGVTLTFTGGAYRPGVPTGRIDRLNVPKKSD